MDTLSFCVVVALVCTAGCASTHVVDSDHPEQWVPSAQDQLLEEDVDVRMLDGRAYSGTLTLLGPDSLKLNDDEKGIVVTEALSNVSYVGEPTNAWPPILGCIGGALVGALVGASLAIEEPEASSGGFNLLTSTAQGEFWGALVGGAVGVTIGSVASKVDQYEIHQGGKKATPRTAPSAEKK